MKIQSSRVKLDKIDRKILEILHSNAKITNAQLSKDVYNPLLTISFGNEDNSEKESVSGGVRLISSENQESNS